jgi:hypothetical protein
MNFCAKPGGLAAQARGYLANPSSARGNLYNPDQQPQGSLYFGVRPAYTAYTSSSSVMTGPNTGNTVIGKPAAFHAPCSTYHSSSAFWNNTNG